MPNDTIKAEVVSREKAGNITGVRIRSRMNSSLEMTTNNEFLKILNGLENTDYSKQPLTPMGFVYTFPLTFGR